jgi:hypothetical protein
MIMRKSDHGSKEGRTLFLTDGEPEWGTRFVISMLLGCARLLLADCRNNRAPAQSASQSPTAIDAFLSINFAEFVHFVASPRL